MKFTLVFVIGVLAMDFVHGQGSYAPNAEMAGTDAIYFESEKFKSWASEITLERGFKDIANKSIGSVNFGTPNEALGISDKSAVSFGDSGVAVLSFNGWITNGSGPDFAVFENSFNNEFLELAFVEVSKDGTNFFRFPAYSETPVNAQISSFDLLDASNIKNLAGKYKVQYGTPFDLDDVAIDSVRYVRIVDVVGSIDTNIASKDAQGRIINDPYPTDFQNNGFYTGGFDLDAIGLINYDGEIFLNNAEVNSLSLEISLFPNPTKTSFSVSGIGSGIGSGTVEMYSLNGEKILSQTIDESSKSVVDVSDLQRGMYLVSISSEDSLTITKVVLQ